MAYLKLAQTYRTSVAAIFDQFRLNNAAFESLLINRTLGLSWDEFKAVMTGPAVPFEAITGLSYDQFSADDWNNFTAEEWYGLLAYPTFRISKASLFFRVGGKSQVNFSLSDTARTVIDPANFVAFDHGPYRVHRTAAGMATGDDDGQSHAANTHAYFLYTIRAASDKPTNLWIQSSQTSTNHEFDVLIDGVEIFEHREVGGATTAHWTKVPLALGDTEPHTLMIRLRRPMETLSGIVIDPTSATYTGASPAFTASPYVTVHASLTECDNDGLPTTDLPGCYDAHSTEGSLAEDGWHDFDLNDPAAGAQSSDRYAVVVSVAGGSDGHFVIWDTSPASEDMPSCSHNGTLWSQDAQTNYAVLLYSDRVQGDPCVVQSRSAQELEVRVDAFRSADAKMTNCVFRTGDATATDKVVIEKTPIEATFLVDQSGSMTWNDRRKQRLDLVARAATRVATALGEDATFSLVTFGGRKAIPVLFTTASKLPLGDGSKLINDYFLNNAVGRAAGVRVIRKTGSYPQSPTDGELVADRICSRVRDTGLTAGVDYRYAVYTYGAGKRSFSAPKYIAATPSSASKPVGITNLTYGSVKGVGVRVDPDVVAAYHLSEGSGTRVYDFALNGNHLSPAVGTRLDWLLASDVVIGGSGLRFDGAVQYLASAVGTAGVVSTDLTVMAWVYWNGDAGTIVARETSSARNFSLAVDSSGHLVFKRGSTTATSVATLTANTWKHVAVTLAGTSLIFYVAGVAGTAQTLTSTTDASTAMAVTIGASTSGATPFRGRISEVTIHKIARSGSYVANYANPSYYLNADNGERVITLNWVANVLSAGTAVVVENSDHAPSSASDGTVVYEGTCTAGFNEVAVRPALRAGASVYYRVFIRSVSGQYSSYEDGKAVRVGIPAMTPDIGIPTVSIDAPTGFAAQRTGPYVYLKWTVPTDDDVAGIAIFASADEQPVVNSLTEFTGRLIYDSSVIDTEAHVSLAVPGTYKFSAVFVDRFGRISPASYATEVPATNIPPAPVKAVRFETADIASLELAWENPESFLLNGTGYLGDQTYVYGGLLDEYGTLMSGVPSLKIAASLTATVDETEDVFDLGKPVEPEKVDPADFVSLTSSTSTDGLVRAEVRTTLAPEGSAFVSNIAADLSLECSFNDASSGRSFSYKSSPASLSIAHPLSISITNPTSDSVTIRERGEDGRYVDRTYVGCYARRNAPVMLRVNIFYRGTPLAAPSLTAFARRTADITGTVTSDPNINYTVVDTDVDAMLATPTLPEKMTLFVRTSQQLAVRTASFDVRYANPLRVEISPHPVLADGNSTVEQMAGVSVVNPNDPELVSSVPALTLVRWTIGSSNRDVPFYSTDNTKQPNGVYSFVRNGVAKKVFTGPITLAPSGIRNVPMTTRVVYDGLVAEDTADLLFYGADAPDAPPPAARFLTNMDVAEVWADGSDYAKLTIVHDATAGTPENQTCFLDCTNQVGATVVTLPSGQPVRIVTPDDFEIIWGDVTEDGSNRTLTLGETAKTATGSATITLGTGATTNVYLRLNRTDLVNQTDSYGYHPCDCFRKSRSSDPRTCVISLDASVFVDGASVPARSGGGQKDGMPPLYLTPKEPLSIRAVDIRVDDVPSDVFVVDGESQNVLVFEVLWRNGPVPDGTRVDFATTMTNGADGKLQTLYSFGFTRQIIDPLLNPEGPVRSFVSVPVLPVSPEENFNGDVTATVSYDASEKVTRSAKGLVSIQYISSFEPNRASAVISGGLQRLAISTGVWSDLPSLDFPRAGLTLSKVGSALYAIGGSNGRSISQVVERYVSGAWSRVEDIGIGRAYALSFVQGGKIHVVGGVFADGLTDAVAVSARHEVYNPSDDSWTLLSPLPVPVAMGQVVMVGDVAFVFGGFSAVNPTTGAITAVNQAILRYDAVAGTWTSATGVPAGMVRVGASAFLDGTTVRSVGGARVGTDGLTPVLGVLPVRFDASGTAANAVSTIAADDASYGKLPSPRYRAASIKLGSSVYVVGGAVSDFPVTDKTDVLAVTSGLWQATVGAGLPLAVHSAGVAADDDYVYVCGGISTGRGSTFLSLIVEGPAELRADGLQSATVRVSARDRNGNFPSNVPLRVNVAVKPTGYDPATFELSDSTVSNAAYSSAVALPRADDILHTAASLASLAVVKGSGAKTTLPLSVDVTVAHATYVGKSSRPEAQTIVDSGVFTSGNHVYVRGSQIKSEDDRGVFFSRPRGGILNFLPQPLAAGDSLSLSLVSDIDWVPDVRKMVVPGGSEGDLIDAVAALKAEVPMGCSPLADGILRTCEVINGSIGPDQNPRRAVYLLTDGDRNFESVGYAAAIEEAEALSGSRPVPFVVIDLSRQATVVEEGSKNSSRDPDLDQLALATGGQAMSFVRDDALDQTVRAVAGGLTGAVGYGTFVYDVDIIERSLLKRLQISATASANASVTWRYSLSEDGEVFSPWSEEIWRTQAVEFDGITAKVVRFRVGLTSGLTSGNSAAAETGAVDAGPVLDALTVVFHKTLTDHVFLKSQEAGVEPTEVTLAVDAIRHPATEVDVGISTYEGYSWDRFRRSSEKAGQNRKSVMLCRASAGTREPLKQIDAFSAQPFYGRWAPDASIRLFNRTGETVDSTYVAYPDLGLIVFAKPISQALFVEIRERPIVKIALRLVSRAGDQPVTVEGVGASYVGRPV